jgi:hypothetical protein
MAERFTKTDVRRAFAQLSAIVAPRGLRLTLSIYAPGDGITRYRVCEASDNGGESNIFPYAYLGAREAYIGIMNTVRTIEAIPAPF